MAGSLTSPRMPFSDLFSPPPTPPSDCRSHFCGLPTREEPALDFIPQASLLQYHVLCTVRSPISTLTAFCYTFFSAFKNPDPHILNEPKLRFKPLFISLKLTTYKYQKLVTFSESWTEASKSISLATIYCVFEVYFTHPLSFRPPNKIQTCHPRQETGKSQVTEPEDYICV